MSYRSTKVRVTAGLLLLVLVAAMALPQSVAASATSTFTPGNSSAALALDGYVVLNQAMHCSESFILTFPDGFPSNATALSINQYADQSFEFKLGYYRPGSPGAGSTNSATALWFLSTKPWQQTLHDGNIIKTVFASSLNAVPLTLAINLQLYKDGTYFGSVSYVYPTADTTNITMFESTCGGGTSLDPYIKSSSFATPFKSFLTSITSKDAAAVAASTSDGLLVDEAALQALGAKKVGTNTIGSLVDTPGNVTGSTGKCGEPSVGVVIQWALCNMLDTIISILTSWI